MGWKDAFRLRPRDASVVGIPLTSIDQLFLFWNNRTTQSTGVAIRATVYDPATDKTRSFPAVGPLSSTGTTFANETTTGSPLGVFSDGELLVAVSVTANNITDPTQLWAAVELFRGGNSVAFLCQGYVHSRSVPSWAAGSANLSQLALANPATDWALFAYNATVVNDAGAAGSHVYTFTPGTGSRMEIQSLWLTNGDTAARVVSANISVGGDLVQPLAGAAAGFSLGAAASTNLIVAGAAGQGLITPGHPVQFAAGAILTVTLADVAASENSACFAIFRVKGAAPGITEAGGAAAVATVEQETFLTG